MTTRIAALRTNEAPRAGVGKIALASLVGTTIEFYDFYIFGTAAALVFGPMFFPKSAPATQTLNAYLTFGLAFLARPVGSFLFGHFGDRIGRKSTLVATMLTMGLATTLIGALPSYASAGVFAPWALAALRFVQGVGLGGEWGGAALIAVENAPEGKRAWYGMFPQLGPPIGFLIATGLFLLLLIGFGEAAFVDWAWRLPFLLSAVLVAIGLYVRVSLEETPAFKALEQDERAAVPLATILRDQLAPLIQGSLAIVVCYALFYIATVYMLGYGVRALGIPRVHFLGLLCGAIVFMALATPLSLRSRTVLAGGRCCSFPPWSQSRSVSPCQLCFRPGRSASSPFSPWRWVRWVSPSRRLERSCRSSFRSPSATPGRRAHTISAASWAPPSRRRWRRFWRRAEAWPGSAITLRLPA
jgi:MFS family permease